VGIVHGDAKRKRLGKINTSTKELSRAGSARRDDRRDILWRISGEITVTEAFYSLWTEGKLSLPGETKKSEEKAAVVWNH